MRNLFKLSFLFLYLFLISCEEEVKPIVDYRCKVETTSPVTGRVYANTPVPIRLKIVKNDDQVGNYQFSYTAIEGGGDLIINGQKIKEGDKLPVDIETVTASYVPTILGQHKLMFRFENEEYRTEALYSISATDLVFEARAENLPKKLLVDKPIAFDLNLSQKEVGEISEFNARIQILKGKGSVSFLGDKNDSLTLQNKKGLRDSLPTKAGTDPDIYKVRLGSNKLHYLSSESGENILLLRVENEYGYSQDISVPLNIEFPEYAVHLTADSLASVGTLNNFLLNVEDTDNFGQNNYSVTYRNLKNSGTLKINNNEVQVGSALSLHSRENICEFIPKELGAAALEFIIRDKYNTTHKDTAMFNVVRSFVKIDISNYDSTASVYDTRDFNFSVSKTNYTGKYYFNLITTPLGSAKVKINGADYPGGKTLIGNIYNTLVSFVPKTPGKIQFVLNVYDDYDSESSRTLLFNVTNSAGKISISNHNPGLSIFSATTFNFSVSKPNYSGTYQYEIIQMAGTPMPGDFGKLKVNGTAYTGGRLPVTNPNNMTVTFTPEKTGDVKLQLKVYDEFGGEITEELPFSVNNTDIKISVVGAERNIILGKESSFSLTANKPYYDGRLSYQITQEPSFGGTIKVNGHTYISGVETMSNNTPINISFTPITEGTTNLIIKTYDEWGGSVRYPVTYTVTNPPIRLETFNFSASSVFQTENTFSIAVSKENYSDGFQYSITTIPASAGTVKVNNAVYGGGAVNLENPGNSRIGFTPSVKGEVTLHLTVTDKTRGKSEREFVYKVENPQIQLATTNVEDDLTLNRRSSFNFSVSKAGYSGKFRFELTGTNCTDLKIGNAAYTPGEKTEVTTPLGTAVSFIPTRVGRDTVQLHLKVYDEWGGIAEKKLSFSVTNSDIELNLSNIESSLFIGRESRFNFTATKAGYTGKLKYEIRTTPSGMGTLKVNGADYISGQQDIQAGTQVPVIFTPLKEGSVNVKLIVTDDWSGEKSRSIDYTITSTPIVIEVADHVSEAAINTPSVFTLSLSKLYYTGGYNYSITTTPASAGTIKVNDAAYTGGRLPVTNPNNMTVSFTPSSTGEIAMNISITDNIGGKQSRSLVFHVGNNPISLAVSNQEVGLTTNKETGFNFAVSKKNYTGRFQFEVLTQPVSAGTLKVNGAAYAGGRTDVSNVANTKINFTPSVTGDVKLILKAYDETTGEVSKEIPYFVTNSALQLTVSNQEKDVYNGQLTVFNFSVSKPGYSKGFKYEITQSPENSGELKVNGTAYTSGKAELTKPELSTVEYTPHTNGQNILTLKVYDELGGTTQENIIFNSLSGELDVQVTNREMALSFNTPSTFNAVISKPKYTGAFNLEMDLLPAASGTLKIDGKPYAGGIVKVADPKNLPITFTPSKEGQLLLKLKITDEIGGVNEQLLDFSVTNPEIKIAVTNLVPDILLNASGSFNFAVSKSGYTGTFRYQIEQDPAGMGTLKMNGTDYSGGKMQLADKDNNTVLFTAIRPGSVTLKLTVTDGWGKEASRLISYSVSNTNMKVDITEKEYELALNKATAFKFAVSKPGYMGTYNVKIIQEPEASGSLKLNGSAYTSGSVSVPASNNTVEFIPSKTGAALLKLIVTDEHGGEKEVAANFNVSNPEIKVSVTNQETDLTYNKATTFNAVISKANYSGTYQYEILQNPVASGTLTVDGKNYAGGVAPVTNPNNLLIGFTPKKEGWMSLLIRITDNTGNLTEKTVYFSVSNPQIILTLNTPENREITLGLPASFTMKAEKPDYSGTFKYELTPIPVDCGDLKISGSPNLSGNLPTNPSTITFTPSKTGTAVITVKVEDETGNSAAKQAVFKVVNSPLKIDFLNAEANCVMKSPTVFNFKVTKPSYPSTGKITYTVTPTTSGSITVDGTAYNGTGVQTTYAKAYAGLPVTFTPSREGPCELNFSAQDEFGGQISKSITFNVSNPEMSMFLTGVNVGTTNDATLGNTYKFYYNIKKSNYLDDFTYWITLDPAVVGIVGTSDVTPRGRMARSSGGGVQMETGTIKSSSSGVTTGEIRFTPSNSDFLNQEVKVNIRVRDKWGSESRQDVRFRIVTSAIAINVSRKTSIPVEEPYPFYFTVSKPGYTGGFKYSLVGWSEGDVLELSADNSRWTTYSGGKFTLPDPDHTYVRYTPKSIGTVPLKLFIYDDANGETMQELTFDVTAPAVAIKADATLKQGFTNQYVPFSLTATDGQKENMDLTFTVDNADFSGELRFNGNPVVTGASRARSGSSSFSVASGTANRFEMRSFKPNVWTATTTATNRWKQTASVSTSIQVTNRPTYKLTAEITGATGGNFTILADGKIDPSMEYKEGTNIRITVNSPSGYTAVGWLDWDDYDMISQCRENAQSSAEEDQCWSGFGNTFDFVMTKDKNIQVNLRQIPDITLSTGILLGQGTITVSPKKSAYSPGEVVTLTAVPAAGWNFQEWNNNGKKTNNPLPITMNKSEHVNVIFSSPNALSLSCTYEGKRCEGSLCLKAGTTNRENIPASGLKVQIRITETVNGKISAPKYADMELYNRDYPWYLYWSPSRGSQRVEMEVVSVTNKDGSATSLFAYPTSLGSFDPRTFPDCTPEEWSGK